MNKNEQIIESLHRVKLLMGYKSTMTLTENVENLKNSLVTESTIITEQSGKSILRALFGSANDAARAASTAAKDLKYLSVTRSLDDAMAYAGKLAQTDGKFLSTSDDVIKAMERGTLSVKSINQLKKGFLQSGKVGPELRETLISQAANDARNIKTFQGMTQTEIKEALVKKGYNQGIADELATRLQPKVGGKLPVKGKTTTTGKGKNTTPPEKPRVKPGSRTYKPDPSKVTVWETIKGRIVGLTRGKIFKYLLIAGGLYLVYKWWIDEGSAPFPDCISKNIPQEDFEKMVSDGLDYVLITDTGNTTIDQNGGGRFFDDKKFTTGNGKYSGTWSEKDGGIVISVSGTDYSISCEGMSDSDDDNDNGNGDGDSVTTYKVCDSFPLTKGCKGGKVSEFQKCIGVSADGKFGPKTEQGLKDKGYSTTVTQEVYDKILKNCGKSNSDTNPNAPKPDAGSPDDDK